MLKVVLYLDGRPGHEKQSRGILLALKKYIDLDIDEVSVEQKSLFRNLVDHIQYFLLPAKGGAEHFRADLVIGTGSRTHIPVLSSKKRHGGYAITCMSPSSYIQNHFDLCFIPFHDRQPSRANIVETIGPPNISASANAHDEERSMILVGGKDKRSHQWHAEKLLNDIQLLVRSAPTHQWTISSSPRTPEGTDDMLRTFVEKESNVHYTSFSDTTPGWVEKQYSLNTSVWVTGDSISMVYEALSAGCSVGIIPVDWNRKKNKFRYSLDYLVNSKRVVTLDQYLEGEKLCRETPPLNESDRCAREIVKRWWPENLQ